MASRTTTKKAGAVKAPARNTRTRTASSSRSAAPRRRAKAQANGTAVAVTKASAEVINKSGLPKMGKGGLETAVFDHMAANPKSEYTPTDLARVLNRSGGAIANALAKFATEGKVTQTSERPRRYRLAGARAVRKTSARKR
jgi:hypothetical protein